MYKKFLKRLFDILLSVIGLTLCIVPMAIIALAVKLDSPGPVLFKQKRIGYKGKVFEMWKFRTMCVGAEQMGSGVYSEKGDPRVTRIGKILRMTSLDELPQFFNTLTGKTSFIGPLASTS